MTRSRCRAMSTEPPAPRRREREHSAGGVVVRGEETIVIVAPRRTADGRQVLALPKGHVDPGESEAQAAAREVREEAGVAAELVEQRGDVCYWQQREGARISRRVAFSPFDCRAGDPADHDTEVEVARWMPLPEAIEALSY